MLFGLVGGFVGRFPGFVAYDTGSGSAESLILGPVEVVASSRVGTTHRGSLFCSCPPSAFGLLLLYLTKKTPPARRAAHGMPADNIRRGETSGFLERIWYRRAIEAASMPAAGTLVGHWA